MSNYARYIMRAVLRVYNFLRPYAARFIAWNPPGIWHRLSEDARFAITNLLQVGTAGVIAVVLLACGLFANQAGFFGPTSTDNGERGAGSKFSLRVGADGKTVYEGASAISEELREQIMGKVFPSPDAAMEAVEGPLAGNPAYAHANNVCWHHRYGKKSRDNGSSFHWTFWRKDYGGYRYTTTQHKQYRYGQPLVMDTFKIRTNKRFCRKKRRRVVRGRG